MQVGSENSWRRQQELTSFSSFSKTWIHLWHCRYNYNVTDKCGVFEGWRLIVGDVGGKAECGQVLLSVYSMEEEMKNAICFKHTPDPLVVALSLHVKCVQFHSPVKIRKGMSLHMCSGRLLRCPVSPGMWIKWSTLLETNAVQNWGSIFAVMMTNSFCKLFFRGLVW